MNTPENIHKAAMKYAAIPEEGADEMEGAKYIDFVAGVLSPEAKEYHTANMFSIEQVRELVKKALFSNCLPAKTEELDEWINSRKTV